MLRSGVRSPVFPASNVLGADGPQWGNGNVCAGDVGTTRKGRTMKKTCLRFSTGLLGMLFLAGSCLPVLGGETYWQHGPGVPGDWFDGNNWTGGIPGDEDTAYVDNGGTAALSYGLAEAELLYVGHANVGAMVQSGSSGLSVPSLYLGDNSGATGNYELSAVELYARFLYVGYKGVGSFLQTAGQLLEEY